MRQYCFSVFAFHGNIPYFVPITITTSMYRLSTLFFLLLSFHSLSQNQVGIFAGPQMSSAVYKIGKQQQETSFKYGFHAGVLMKVPFEGIVSFAPSISYSLIGYDVDFDRPSSLPDPDAIDNSTRFHSVSLAPLLQFDLGRGPSHVFIKAGPSFDFMLKGKESFQLSGGSQVDRNVKFGNYDYGYVTANLIGQLGFEKTQGFYISLNYSYSPANLSNRDGGPTINNQILGFSLGWYLKRKKIVIDTRVKE
ncbi:MAG: PorT family protein [Chitinophagaceae bacterium]|nr:PorT family protein [Chitinophagaceae bacterium]